MDIKDKIIKEAIDMELNIGELYLLFSEMFSEEKDFWIQMNYEEKEHAKLIRKFENFLDFKNFDDKQIDYILDNLTTHNKLILEAFEKYKKETPDKDTAYAFALKIEEDAFELHSQEFMEKIDNIKAMNLFLKLSSEDERHSNIIKDILKEELTSEGE